MVMIVASLVGAAAVLARVASAVPMMDYGSGSSSAPMMMMESSAAAASYVLHSSQDHVNDQLTLPRL
jgi:hypothetical protein